MKTTAARCTSTLVIAACIALTGTAGVAGGIVNTGYFGGVAIKGYDTVSYFTESKAVKGTPEYKHSFLGETWHFSTAEHRDLFAGNPVAYAPQYGGFCAGEVLYADVSTGVTTNIDPEAWRIIDGKLYLFYDKGYAQFFEDEAVELIDKADARWPTVRQRLAEE